MPSQPNTVTVHPNNRPIALVIHGMAGSHRALIPMAKALIGFKVKLIDLPGHGESAPLPGEPSVKKLVSWLNSYIASMPDMPSLIIGHSYGSLIATLGAIRDPELYPKLVLCNPINYRPSARNRIMRIVYEMSAHFPQNIGSKIAYSRTVADMMGNQMFVTQNAALRKHLNDIGYEDKLRVPFRDGVKLILESQSIDMTIKYQQLSVPTLAITTQDDPCIDQASIDSLMCNNNISTIVASNAGHLMPLESPERVAKKINKWLASFEHEPSMEIKNTMKV